MAMGGTNAHAHVKMEKKERKKMVVTLSGYVYLAIVAAVGDCLDGVMIGNQTQKSSWVISFKPSATEEQRTAAQNVLNALDYDAYLQSETTRINDIQADAGRTQLLDRLRNATNAQIDTWINANVTTLAQARDVLKAIVKILSDVV